MTKPDSNDLLSCPDCGADPTNSCTIDVIHGREPHDKNHATVRCHECGYTASIVTSVHPGIIRRIWNVRIR